MNKMIKLAMVLAVATLTVGSVSGCQTRKAGRTHAHRTNVRHPNSVRHHQLPPPAQADRPENPVRR